MNIYLVALSLPCWCAMLKTSATPPALLIDVTVTSTMPRAMINVCSTSVHITAFSPPYSSVA